MLYNNNFIMKNKTLLIAIFITVIVNLLFLISLILVIVIGHKQPYTALFITLFMFAYHIDVRAIIGATISLFKGKININSSCFKISIKEFKFLNLLRVKQWKKHFVTLFENQFSVNNLNLDNIEKILKNNINAEIVHTLCFFAGFLAILFGWLLSRKLYKKDSFAGFLAILFGWLLSPEELLLYIITSAIASMFIDLPAILIQRYNRFRLLKIKNKVENS